MKRFSAVSLIVLFSMSGYAQEKPAASGKQDPVGVAPAAHEEVRIRALEEQVRTLAEEVALLRGELKTIRDTKSADPATGSRLLLAAARSAVTSAWFWTRPQAPPSSSLSAASSC
jgi:hypothetical protein